MFRAPLLRRGLHSMAGGRLHGRVSVVTGGSVGIGRAIANRFAQDGSSVVVADIDEEAGNAAVAHMIANGGKAKFIRTNMMEESEIEDLMRNAVQEYGRLDVLVNNATQFSFGHLGEAGKGSQTPSDFNPTDEQWERLFRVNMLGYSKAMKHAMNHMRNNDLQLQAFSNDEMGYQSTITGKSRGAIVNIASISSVIAQPEMLPYNASKAAVLSMTKCAALDSAKDHIRINAISPGSVLTPASYRHMEAQNLTPEEGRQLFGDGCPMKRQCAPEEIASVASFLASDDASYMTGSNIMVDGGQTLGAM